MIKIISGLIVCIISIIFIIQNSEIVDINFLYWTLSLPGSAMMAILLFSGFFIGWVMSSLKNIKKNKKGKKKD